MKHWKMMAICLLIMVELISCSKPGSEEPGPGTTDTTGVSGFFEKLEFFASTKITGEVPAPAANAILKKSFKDTLVLFENLQTPFKFLHEDKLSDVAGLFVSFPGSPFYYDVPELQDSKTNDTVSVFTMGYKSADGFRSANGNDAETAEITITPYNSARQPLTKFKTKVNVKKPKEIDVDGFCGLELEWGEFWDWELSYVPGTNGIISFINYPLKVWGAEGQRIKGSCCGVSTSIYGLCPGADSANKSLHFNTFFGYPFEHFAFSANRSFTRQTAQIYGKPDLNNSNWCTNFAKTDTSIQLIDYAGTWSVSERSVPAGINVDYSTRDYLTLLTTSSQGGLGYGNPGGFIHVLECGGYLWLIQPDNEGSTGHLYKFYIRKKENEEYWHIIDS
jgi:hypothetical protein